MSSTLLLNADFQPMELSPLSTLSWKESISAYYKDSIYIFKTHDNWKVRSPSIEFDVPSIIVAKMYHKRKSHAKLSRRNLFIRDDYRCQYCGVKFYHHELTFDHVIPRLHGGKSTWQNMASGFIMLGFACICRALSILKAPFVTTRSPASSPEVTRK